MTEPRVLIVDDHSLFRRGCEPSSSRTFRWPARPAPWPRP